jgi:hypothetical protein
MKTAKTVQLWLLTILVMAGVWSAGLGAAAGQHGIAAAGTPLVARHAPNATGHVIPSGIWMGE